MAREFDLVVYGATGFTGRLVAEYLGRTQPEINWALAGRSLERLQEIAAQVAGRGGEKGTTPLITASADSYDSLLRMAERTRVVLSTVGPFTQYGTPLIRACVAAGTHYVDTTGETTWVRDMIDHFHEEAQSKGVVLVPMCGFDSVPADLGALLCVHEASNLHTQVTDVDAVVTTAGSASGGTIASAFGMLENKAALRRSRHPFFLNPTNSAPVRQGRSHDSDRIGIRYSRPSGVWTVPFLMAAVNTRVVRRSQALQLSRYGPQFSYNEAQAVPAGLLVAVIIEVVMVLAFVLLQLAIFRSLARRFLPAPGQGPSAATRARSSFTYRLHANTTSGRRITVTIAGGDPGYDETAKMVAESALCLVSRPLNPGHGGLLTPASACGLPLAERLQAAGMIIKIETI